MGRASPGANGHDVSGIQFSVRRAAPTLLLPWLHSLGQGQFSLWVRSGKDGTWADYQREAGGWLSSRDDFDDALAFMGWYISQTQRLNGVSKWDAYGQVLNYQEVVTGYHTTTHRPQA